MHLLILPYLDCSDSHAYTISLELCAGFNDSTHKTSLLHFESVILYAPLHKDKLRTTAGDRGGAGLFDKILQILRHLQFFLLKFHENCCFFKPIFCENFEIAAVQKDANLVELEKCCRTHIFLQNFVLIQPRTSPPKICKIFEKCIFEKCIFENAHWRSVGASRCRSRRKALCRWSRGAAGQAESSCDLKQSIPGRPSAVSYSLTIRL